MTTPTSATSPSREVAGGPGGLAREVLGEGFSYLSELRARVQEHNACELPGISVKYDSFIPVMWRAVALGFVRHEHATFVGEGLRWGFKVGVDIGRLKGHRWFSNYPTAVTARGAVTKAIVKRVEAGKTIRLGTWSNALARVLRGTFSNSFIFPMGAVDKPDGSEKRPTSDHTRTGLNAATDLGFLAHSLTAYADIEWFLKQDYFMRVSDVESAFLLLPLHPDLWPFFLFRFFDTLESSDLTLYAHVCGDFGAAGMPGVFKIFFADVVVNMARSLRVLTLPMAIYVDDNGLIGEDRGQVDAEMSAFQSWAWEVCGVPFKALKDRMASQVQLMLGFVWDSTTLTRTLPEKKLLQYVDMLTEMAGADKLTLKDLQVVAGRMQRAIMTLPPGAACLLVGIFSLMAGLKLPWHVRRLNRGVREDFKFLNHLLSINLGKGFYSFANFEAAPECRSDASKSRHYTGGGWLSKCGRYALFEFGSKASREPIDYLEGDTVLHMVEALGHRWGRCRVPIGIDNSAFQQSLGKGRSKAPRLNVLVRRLFVLQVRGQFVLDPFWLSTVANRLADHLSRDREADCLEEAITSGFWPLGTWPRRHESSGTIRRLDPDVGAISKADIKASDIDLDLDPVLEWGRIPLEGKVVPISASGEARFSFVSPVVRSSRGALQQLGVGYSSNTLRDGPPTSFISSVPYSRASLFQGLPLEWENKLEELLDNRLATSSWNTVSSGVRRWRAVAATHGWPAVIPTDDPARGGKLVTFVLTMVYETELAYSSIELYAWGMRTWQKLQHQQDPALGVMGYEDFMKAVKVATFVPSEPHKQTPHWVIDGILKEVEEDPSPSFEDVQFAFYLLVSVLTFARSEQLPKAWTGVNSFDSEFHWQVKDFDVRDVEGVKTVAVRFKAYKQDSLQERPEAKGGGDWRYLSSLPENPRWCPLVWLLRLNGFHGPRAQESPFFVTTAGVAKAWRYKDSMDVFKRWQRKLGVPEDEMTGTHGSRVYGYNSVRAILGADLAQCHGGWESKAHERYRRFKPAEYLAITAAVAAGGMVPIEGAPGDGERVLRRGGGPIQVFDQLPPGWAAIEEEGLEGCFGNADGDIVSSTAEAWKVYEEAVAAGEEAPVAVPTPTPSRRRSPEGAGRRRLR